VFEGNGDPDPCPIDEGQKDQVEGDGGVKRSTAFWILTYATMAAGFGYSIYGVYISNLYAMIMGPLVAGLSGVWAQLAAKYQAEQMQSEKTGAEKAPAPPTGTKEKAKSVLKLVNDFEERALELGLSRDDLLSILIYFLSRGIEERAKAEKISAQRTET